MSIRARPVFGILALAQIARRLEQDDFQGRPHICLDQVTADHAAVGFAENGMAALLDQLEAFRPEYDAPWTGLPHVTSIALDRLGSAEVETLAEQVAGRPLPPR